MILVLAFVFIINSVSATHIDWALQHGAYLHKHIEYRDKGMYATGPINKSELIASIPKTLEFQCENCSNIEYVQSMERELEKPESFWAPYFNSLPDTCQNALCSPLNYSIFTVRGGLTHNKSFQKTNESIVQSRRWTTGMRPLMELFNHHNNAYPVVENATHYLLNASVNYAAGNQVYDKYTNSGIFKKYLVYGFIDTEEPTCEDMKNMRVGNDIQRVACIAYSNSTISLMLDEIEEARKHGDLAMIKGASQWLDRNIVHTF